MLHLSTEFKVSQGDGDYYVGFEVYRWRQEAHYLPKTLFSAVGVHPQAVGVPLQHETTPVLLTVIWSLIKWEKWDIHHTLIRDLLLIESVGVLNI
jgi:hypothetical protein